MAKSTGTARRKTTKRRSTGGGSGSSKSHATTDHQEIREWVEQRGGTPACVKGTGGDGDAGVLRIDFPGYSGEDSLEPMEWDDWFRKFDREKLAMVVQERTRGGQQSRFGKLVQRETARKKGASASRKSAGGKTASRKNASRPGGSRKASTVKRSGRISGRGKAGAARHGRRAK